MSQYSVEQRKNETHSLMGNLALFAVIGIALANPFFWCFAIVVFIIVVAGLSVGVGTSLALVTHFGIWCLLPLFVLSLLGPVRQRISGRYEIGQLTNKLSHLQNEISQLHNQLNEAHHEIDYLKLVEQKHIELQAKSPLRQDGKK